MSTITIKPCDWDKYWSIHRWCEDLMGMEGYGTWASKNLRCPISCQFYVKNKKIQALFKLTWL